MNSPSFYSHTKFEKAITSEQFNQIVEAILAGKYSWACFLILRFAGYNPLHYIPYRTYNRLIKENNQATRLSKDETHKSNMGAQVSQQKINSEDTRKYAGSLSDLAYCEAISERQKNERGSKLEWGLLNKVREYSSCQAKLLSLKNYSLYVTNGKLWHELK